MKTKRIDTIRLWPNGDYKEWKFRNYILIADKGRVNLENPGDDTPAMIYVLNRKNEIIRSSTYWCAIGETAIEDVEMAESVWEYFNSLSKELETFLYD